MTESLADDLLPDIDSIALFMFGRAGPPERRRLYHLTSEVAPAHRLPTFKLGGRIMARKSTVVQWIADREHGDCGVVGL
jgi:hypothetical protein